MKGRCAGDRRRAPCLANTFRMLGAHRYTVGLAQECRGHPMRPPRSRPRRGSGRHYRRRRDANGTLEEDSLWHKLRTGEVDWPSSPARPLERFYPEWRYPA